MDSSTPICAGALPETNALPVRQDHDPTFAAAGKMPGFHPKSLPDKQVFTHWWHANASLPKHQVRYDWQMVGWKATIYPVADGAVPLHFDPWLHKDEVDSAP